MKDKTLKLAIISIFATIGIQHFQFDIEAVLIDNVFNLIYVQDRDGNLKVVCDIVQDHDLDLHAKSVKSLIGHRSLNATSGYVAQMGDEERQNRISSIH